MFSLPQNARDQVDGLLWKNNTSDQFGIFLIDISIIQKLKDIVH
jgi:hypothetical protein